MDDKVVDFQAIPIPTDEATHETAQLLLLHNHNSHHHHHHSHHGQKHHGPHKARLANYNIEVKGAAATPLDTFSHYRPKLLAILRAIWVTFILPWMRIPMFCFSAFLCLCDQFYKIFFRDNIPFILIYIAGAYYGLFVSWSDCHYDWTCLIDLSRRDHVYLFIAKTCVRISTILTACSAILCVRSISSKLDSVPKMNAYSFNWRRAHSDLALQSYFFATGHVVGHIFRYLDVEQGRRTNDYEYFFMVTGVALTLLLILQLLTLISRWMFRRCHWLFAMIIPVIYYIHSHSYVMLIFLLLYVLDYNLHKEEVRDLHIYGNEKNIILKINCGRNIPNTPGYYYQIAVNNFMASYTFMPYEEGDKDYALFFIQKNSVVANELWKIVRTGNFSRDRHRNIMLNNPGKVVGLWGPFDSNDYVSRKELSKCYITSGAGRSIQYDSYAHRKNTTQTNTKIVYYHLKGRTNQPPQLEKPKEIDSNETNETIETNETENNEMKEMRDISRKIEKQEKISKRKKKVSTRKISVEIGEKKEDFVRQYDQLVELIDNNDTVSVLHKGVFTVDHLETIFEKLQPKGFHFIFCGGGVLTILKEYQKNKRKFQVGNDRIHIESFSSDFTLFGSEASDWSQDTLFDPFSDLG